MEKCLWILAWLLQTFYQVSKNLELLPLLLKVPNVLSYHLACSIAYLEALLSGKTHKTWLFEVFGVITVNLRVSENLLTSGIQLK